MFAAKCPAGASGRGAIPKALKPGLPSSAVRCAGLRSLVAVVPSTVASVIVHVEVYDDLQPNVVIVESIWPSENFVEGIGINALISADPGHGKGGAVFHDTSVWLEKVVD